MDIGRSGLDGGNATPSGA